MSEIKRYDVNEEWAHTGIIKAGDFYYLNYCVGNVGQIDCLFRDIWNIPIMEKVIKERFNGKYPVRKSIQTEFAHVGGETGLQFQMDGIAYKDR